MNKDVSAKAKAAFVKDTDLQEQIRDVCQPRYHEFHRSVEGPGFSTITIAQPRRRRSGQDG
jgi:hypothetical protein